MQGMLHRLSDGSEEEVTVGTKLYVGSLPYTTTDQQLQELFAQHGMVSSAKVISDRYTGRSRGFGFVEMATSEDAQKAIAALNGTQLGVYQTTGSGSYVSESLIRFSDLGIPAGATVTGATLTLSVDSWTANPTVRGYYVLAGWMHLFGTSDFVTVTRTDDADWAQIERTVRAAVAAHL